MAVFTVEIDDKLVQEVGEKTVYDFMQSQADYLRMQYLGEKIKNAIQESGFEHEKEVKEARHAAWKEYKKNNLKGRL